jgi:hypothetical protein
MRKVAACRVRACLGRERASAPTGGLLAHADESQACPLGCSHIGLLVSESGAAAPTDPRTPNHDGLQRRRRSEVRAANKLPANKLLCEELAQRAAQPVPNDYPAMQTHQPTARIKKTCKCRPFVKRLKGFEPSTFCMASSSRVLNALAKGLQISTFRARRIHDSSPPIPPNCHGFRHSTDTEGGDDLG